MTGTMAKKISIAVFALGVLAAGCGSDRTTRDDAGVIVDGGDLGVFSATEGDCVNVPDGDEITQFEGVACTEPHDAQIYAAFDLPAGVFPGLDSVRADADTGCDERWEAFFEIEYARSEYFATRVTPTMESWNKLDDREILCLVRPGPDAPQLTMDLRGYGADLVDEVAEDVAAEDVAGDEPATDAPPMLDPEELAGLIAGGGPTLVSGSIQPGENAAYTVVMEAGQSIGVTLDAAGATGVAISDPVLAVVTADLVSVAENDDADGLNSALIYTASAAGTYTIVAGDLSDLGGEFELAVELVDAGATPSIGAATNVTAELESSVVAQFVVGAASTVSTSETLESGSFDVVELTVDAPVVATITVTGGGVLDPRVTVLSGGVTMAENDDAPVDVGLPSVLDSQVTVELAAGSYQVEVHSYADIGDGDYTIEIVTD